MVVPGQLAVLMPALGERIEHPHLRFAQLSNIVRRIEVPCHPGFDELEKPGGNRGDYLGSGLENVLASLLELPDTSRVLIRVAHYDNSMSHLRPHFSLSSLNVSNLTYTSHAR